jgi:glycosyltransferase involved in cell wall biosynthesis
MSGAALIHDARPPFRDGRISLAILSTYVPRHCGIATFSRDLVTGLQASDGARARADRVGVIALDRPDDRLRYPTEVIHRLEVGDRAAYRQVASRLDRNGSPAVSIQHEYGIFGGPDGRYVLDFVDELRAPSVVTLHTVLADPKPAQRQILAELSRRSGRVVVMAERARRLLADGYGVDPGRIEVIPHGVPDIPLVDPDAAKRPLGLEGRTVILSFGLLGPGKRMELVIDALAPIVRHIPEACYVIAGATHPDVLRRHGESYRRSLEERIERLGLRDHVRFVDRYLPDRELFDWLSASDIFVTPYGNEQQITSGTLAYALAAGTAIVSTPYAHARELLADGRGEIVPFDDTAALSERLEMLLADRTARETLQRRAYAHARAMTWPRVGARHRRLLDQVAVEMARTTIRHRDERAAAPHPLPAVVRIHFDELADRDGFFQHAVGRRPDPRHGYCTDDVARALLVDLRHAAVAPSAALAASMRRWLAFLEDAFDPASGRFRNFRDVDGRWLEAVGSEDCHGRALQALGTAAGRSADVAIRERAARLFEAALPAARTFSALRPRAYVVLGCAEAMADKRQGELSGAMLMMLGRALADAFADTDPEWPWPEPAVTYESALLPQTLIVAGRATGRQEWVTTGLSVLGWLADAQESQGGRFSAIGNDGWWPRGGSKATYDQQPIEAASMIEAAATAFAATRDPRWSRLAERAYAWFLGENDSRLRVADPDRGASHDGLLANGVNPNQGAESTLCWLLAVERIRELRGEVREARRPSVAAGDAAHEPAAAAVTARRSPVGAPAPGIAARS